VSGTAPRGVGARGVVVAFDERAGLGTVDVEGHGIVGFHATQLADGTRTTAVGRHVLVTVVPWHAGRAEATAIVDAPVPAPPT
jgi:hypothetical protein